LAIGQFGVKLAEAPHDKTVFVGSLSPGHVYGMLDKMIEFAKHKRRRA